MLEAYAFLEKRKYGLRMRGLVCFHIFGASVIAVMTTEADKMQQMGS
jgi:hypothetical protein